MAHFIIRELVNNPKTLVPYSEFLALFSSKSFPRHLSSKYQSEIREIYRKASVAMLDFPALYLKIKQLTLQPNGTPNALALLYQILSVGDPKSSLDIYLDGVASITKFPKADFLIYPLLNNIETIASLNQRALKFQELTGNLLKRLKDSDSPYNQTFLVKAMILDGDYVAAREKLLVDILKSPVAEATRTRVEGFLYNLLEKQSREVEIPQYKLNQAARRFGLLTKGLNRSTLLEIFSSEHLDKKILDVFPEGDWAGHVVQRRDLEEYHRLFEKHQGNMAEIEKEVTENKEGNESYSRIGKTLVEFEKRRVEEEERVKVQREKVLKTLSREVEFDELASKGGKKRKSSVALSKDPAEEALETSIDPAEKPKPKPKKSPVGHSKQRLVLKNKLRVDKKGKLLLNQRLFEKFLSIFARNTGVGLSEAPVLEEELAFHYCKLKLKKAAERKARKSQRRLRFEDVLSVDKKSLARVVQRNLHLYRCVKITNKYPEDTLEPLWDLMAWGIQKKEPFAVYLVEKACEVLGIQVPERLARQVEMFLDYSLELPGENSNDFYRVLACFKHFPSLFREFCSFFMVF